MTRLYLAGPDVFLPDAVEVGRRKVELCRAAGFDAVFPLDNAPPEGLSGADLGHAIYRINHDLMLGCDAVLANLTPFRGPSADAGTLFELGVFVGAGKPVHGYSASARGFYERCCDWLGLSAGAERDAEGYALERFDMADNLMIPGAIAAAGGVFATHEENELAAWSAFGEALRQLREQLETDA